MTEPHFLYVEDDPMSRVIIEILLTKVMGYPAVTIFDNSANFLERLYALPQKPTVFLVDIQMAPHDGFEILHMLRGDLNFRQATVIALTANVMANDVEQLQMVGFNGLIGKPVMKDIFPALIERILSGERVWYIP